MTLVSGTILVLATWMVVAVVIVALGLAPARAVHRSSWTFSSYRRALWFGLLVFSVLGLSISLVLPLGGWPAAALVVLGAGISAGYWWSRTPGGVHKVVNPSGLSWLLLGTLLFAQVYLAVAALGPVTNYDSGLYHLGAIEYARQLPAVPGLANLHAPLGYATVEFPLAGLLGGTPWGAEGFRLLNGLLMTLGVLEMALRVLQRRWSVGTYVLAVGLTAAWVPLVALSDYWVTSPSQDSPAFILCIVSGAYLADAAASRRSGSANGATAVVIAVVAVLFRPTLVILALGTIIAVSAIMIRRRKMRWAAVVVTGVLALVAALASAARDLILSGWLQYPLSLAPIPVVWRAENPEALRAATLGYHRDPDDLWKAADGWEWVPRWLERLPTSWETYEFGLLALVAAVAITLAAGRTSLRIQGLAVAVAPSVAAVVFWWAFTPPSFRFAWGPLTMVFAIPIGWSLWRLARSWRPREIRILTVAGLVVPIAAVVAFSSFTRLDVSQIDNAREWNLGFSIPYVVASVPVSGTRSFRTTSGLVLQVPLEGEQCWSEFPLCTPQPRQGLTLRGDGIAGGFVVN